jgi:hypothetical protein
VPGVHPRTSDHSGGRCGDLSYRDGHVLEGELSAAPDTEQDGVGEVLLGPRALWRIGTRGTRDAAASGERHA